MNSPITSPITSPAAGASSAAAAPTSGVARDAAFSMMAKLLYLATRLLLPPMILAHITLADYGLWSACFILIGYIGLADMGFSSVYVRLAARLHQQGDTQGIGRMLSTGISSMLVLAAILLTVLWFAMPSVMGLLKVDPAQRATASVLVLGAVAVFLCDMSLGAFAYVLHGLQKFRDEQKVWVAAYLLEFVAIIAFLALGMGVYALLAAFVVRYMLSMSANAVLAFRALPGLRLSPRRFDRADLAHFLGFGLTVQASSVFAMVLHSVDRLLAGVLLGPQAIALFELGGKLPTSATSIPSSITQATLPAAARLTAPEQRDDLRRLYRQSTRSTSLLASYPLGYLAVFAAPICLAWLGRRDDLVELPLIMTLVGCVAQLHIVTGPGSAVFRALGQLGNEFVYHGLRIAALTIGIGAACAIGGVSATTVAIGIACGGSVAAVLYLAHNHRRLELPLRDLLLHIILPGVGAFVIAALLLPAWYLAVSWLAPSGGPRALMLVLLALFGILYSALLLTLQWCLVFETGERAAARGILLRVATRLHLRRS